MDYGRSELADRLAAEYVAGTLRGPARRRFEALLPAHPGLRAAVSRWQARLMPMTAVIDPIAPPERVWQGIQRRIGLDVASTRPRQVLRWWQRLNLWRAVSAVACTAALVLAAVVLAPPDTRPPVIVMLQSTSGPQQGQSGFVAAFSADGRGLVTRPVVAVSLPVDRALELWAVPPEGAGAPTSLGLIARDAPSVVLGRRLPHGTAVLAVSEEPAGGSPTGAPTGRVLWVGRL